MAFVTYNVIGGKNRSRRNLSLDMAYTWSVRCVPGTCWQGTLNSRHLQRTIQQGTGLYDKKSNQLAIHTILKGNSQIPSY